MKKLKSLVLLLLICMQAQAKFSHTVIDIDGEKILRKTVLQTIGNESSLMLVTDKKLNKKIKFTPYFLKLEKGKTKSLQAIEIEPMEGNKESEEFVMALIPMNQSVLMVSRTDKNKANTIVLRTFSADGKVLESKILSQNAAISNFRCKIVNDKIYLTYQEYENKELTVAGLNSDLSTLNELNVELKGQYHSLHTRGNMLYLALTHPVKSNSDLKDAQITIHKIDIAKAELVKSLELVHEKYFNYMHFFNTAKALEVVCTASPDYDQRDAGVVASIQIDWETLEFKTLFAQLEVMKALKIGANNPSSTKNVGTRILFSPIRQANGSYTILTRLAIEHSRTISEPQSGGGYKTYNYYTAYFNLGHIFNIDSTFTHVSDGHTVKNQFATEGKHSSRLYLMHEPVGDFFMFPFSKDTSKNLLTYITGVELENYKLTLQVRKDSEYLPETPYQIDLGEKGLCFFYMRQIEEMAENEFVLPVFVRGKGYKLVVIQADI